MRTNIVNQCNHHKTNRIQLSSHHHKHIIYKPKNNLSTKNKPKNNPFYKELSEDPPELFKAELLTQVTCYALIHSPISKFNSISKLDIFYIILKLHKLPRLLKDTLSKISSENINDAVASLNNFKIYRWTKLPTRSIHCFRYWNVK